MKRGEHLRSFSKDERRASGSKGEENIPGSGVDGAKMESTGSGPELNLHGREAEEELKKLCRVL